MDSEAERRLSPPGGESLASAWLGLIVLASMRPPLPCLLGRFIFHLSESSIDRVLQQKGPNPDSLDSGEKTENERGKEEETLTGLVRVDGRLHL